MVTAAVRSEYTLQDCFLKSKDGGKEILTVVPIYDKYQKINVEYSWPVPMALTDFGQMVFGDDKLNRKFMTRVTQHNLLESKQPNIELPKLQDLMKCGIAFKSHGNYEVVSFHVFASLD